MTRDEINALREWRDTAEDPDDKALLRKTLKYIESLESRINTATVLLKSTQRELSKDS